MPAAVRDYGKPALQHDKDSRGALAYLALAGEMLRKEDEAANEPAMGATMTTADVENVPLADERPLN